MAIRITETGPLLAGESAEVVTRHLSAATAEATQYGARRVKQRTPQGVDAMLVKSIQPEVRRAGTNQVFGLIGTALAYGQVIEMGRKPGGRVPPKGSLLRWVKFRFGIGGEDAERAETALRFSIAQKGFPGIHMFENTLTEDWDQFVKIFNRHGFLIQQELEG